MSKTEQFLDLYKQLETACSNILGIQKNNFISALSHRADFKNIGSELDYIRDVRNLLTHRPQIDEKYAVEPTDAIIDLLESIIKKINDPLTAMEIMVPVSNILYGTFDSKVLSAMNEMYKKAFTHLPILDDQRVVGVFSDNTLMNYILHGNNEVSSDITFSQIEDVLSFNQHPAETFRFVKRNELVSNISDLFDKSLKDSERIGMIFVTEHGKSEEKLLGIITAWDVAAALE